MKITGVQAMTLTTLVAPRPASWQDTATRVSPISACDGFPAGPPQRTPGFRAIPVWVKVTAEDGSFGLGRCAFGAPVAALIDGHFAPILTGMDGFATTRLNEIMSRSAARFGDGGLPAVAQAGIDLALWDLKGKALGQPVYRLLGGPCRDEIACYATTDDVAWARELGFTGVKIPNSVGPTDGPAGLNQLVDTVAAAREALGPDGELMVNATMSYDVDYAVRALGRLAEFGLTWFEEPLPAHDIAGHIELRRRVPSVPVATGENLHSLRAVASLIAARAVDVLQPDPEFCGITNAITMCAMANAAGIEASPHVAASSPFGQHLAFALPNLRIAEYYLSSPPGEKLRASIPGAALPEAGRLAPPVGPGFGLQIDPDSLAPWDYTDRRACVYEREK
jgi:L-rhamnonate dehydratase